MRRNMGAFVARAGRVLVRTGAKIQAQPVASTREARARVQPDSLLHYAADVYSQRGDDGIIREIFRRLEVKHGFFTEFGAWDGLHLSNARLLYEEGWSGMFIEGDQKRAETLRKRYTEPDVIAIQGFVHPESGPGKKTLDDYCDERGIRDIDFLSIDIDGLDLNVFEGLRLRPKVVAIEGGFSWHPQMKARVPDDVAAKNLQQPVAVAIESVRAKGYEAVCFNQNLYAVHEKFANRFTGYSRDAEMLWLDAYNAQSEAFRQALGRLRASDPLIRRCEAPYRSSFTIQL